MSYLQKPFTPTTLAGKVREVLDESGAGATGALNAAPRAEARAGTVQRAKAVPAAPKFLSTLRERRRVLYFSGALMPTVDPVEIPNRSLFRQPEVCEIAKVQPFVLRTWEAEFPDLGVAKTANGPRVYRRVDVERVLRLKHLLYVEGLTLAGARRKLSEEQPEAGESTALTEVGELLGAEARDRISASGAACASCR